MKINNEWKDYEIIASGGGEKLERWKNVYLLRPDPQVIWPANTDLSKFPKLNARYIRSSEGGGKWEIYKPVPDFSVSWRDINLSVKLMGFKHTGIFPEQAVNWDFTGSLVKNAGREIKVLNLFAYTGAASVALSKAGAKVCHVDSAKGMVDRAKLNAELSGVNNIRYIIDDCKKFVMREIKRGNKYDGILMDPPSYGRGPSGETWKIENDLFPLVKLCAELLSDDPLFFLINSYTTGLQPGVLKNILSLTMPDGEIEAYEVGLPTREGIALPCGASGMFYRTKKTKG